ncbi:uracil-DNA glycosylase-like protein [Protomyces lactucae-debilis]|uniref:Uracil-DNA glycosylase n=1 Tax=Protomyces lactucae-debilis TaxID=2754530 RepID=A0A1Y2FQD5_PROLT|nr:uracil-DNA glycosylase-like protein [Protomyces lactucae-debilis]ORY86190.1 uracil-DNA glycosylase-like protein [Protomyces lactucae-debilis]
MSKRSAAAAASPVAKKLKATTITSFFAKDPAAAPSPAKAKEVETPFSKQSWIDSLSVENKDLLKLEIDTLHESWLSLLHKELTKPYFLKLKEFLAGERRKHKIFPPAPDVYAWSRHTPFESVKVVILGQDPYHNDGQAHGLCFSVQAPTPPPPSLKNIYKCLKIEYPDFQIPKHGSLLAWADRGVLLQPHTNNRLNTCLTVQAHQANSHQKRGWETFTQRVLDLVAEKRTNGVVFMAWGKPASKRVEGLDLQRHLRLESVHPSPLSASRGFFEGGHFTKANVWLTERYGVDAKIDWNSLSGAPEQKQDKTPNPKDEPGLDAEQALI